MSKQSMLPPAQHSQPATYLGQQLIGTQRLYNETYLVRKFLNCFCQSPEAQMPESFEALAKTPNLLEQFNPRKIRPGLLKQLGVKFELKDEAPVVTNEVVDGLVALFKNLQPLYVLGAEVGLPVADNLVSPRFWVISEKCPIEDLRGQLLYFTSRPKVLDPEKPKNLPVADVSIYSNIASCLRSKGHQAKSSEKEIGLISRLAQWGSDLGQILWTVASTGNREEILKELQELAQEATNSMPAPVLFDKERAKGQILSSAEMQDVRKRPNPAANAVRLGSSANKLAARTRTASYTKSYNDYDQAKFFATMIAVDIIFNKAAKRIDPHLRSSKSSAFLNPTYSAEFKIQQVNNFFTSLGLTDRNLDSLAYRPYVTFVKIIKEIKRELEDEIRSGEQRRGLVLLKDLAFVLKYLGNCYPKYLAAREQLKSDSPMALVDARTYMGEYLCDTQNILALLGPVSRRYFPALEERLIALESLVKKFNPLKGKMAFKKLADLGDLDWIANN